MSEYEAQVWRKLNQHWESRNNARGLPNWASSALVQSGAGVSKAADRLVQTVPEAVKEPVRHAGQAIADQALIPALHAATKLVELVDSWALELNDPKSVESLARKRGVVIDHFGDLRQQDLKTCDRLLTRNTLTWRSAGALEGGVMGFLAMVPVAGFPLSMGADALIIQVLSTSIAARIAYSYGCDAKDPAEQEFIEHLVRRSFVAQAAKAKPMSEASKAAFAVRDRVKWSAKLRDDHRLLVGLEKLLQKLGPAGGKASVESVGKLVPFVGVLLGAGVNSEVLARVAVDAQRYCQTRFLCDKYGLPLPVALRPNVDPAPDAAEV
jgi:hypothetical protein